MKYLVLGLVVACSSPRAGIFDANHGDDASIAVDASVDAPPDAPPTPPCSTIVDLDGDGLGWECDPVEHISLPNAAHGFMWFAYLADTTFAAQVGFNCSGSFCTEHAAIEVRPDRAMIRRSDSGLPEDAWLQSSTIGGPCIDSDHAVWWSSSNSGMTGTIDTTGSFAPVASPMLGGCIVVGDTAALLGMTNDTSQPATLTSVMAPGGGALHPFATANFGRIDNVSIDVGFSPAILGVAGQLTSSSATLVQARPGELAPSDVIVDGSSTAVVDVASRLPSTDGGGSIFDNYARSPTSRFYVRRGGNAYYVAITATDVQWAKLPRTDLGCFRGSNDGVYCTGLDMWPTRMTSMFAVRGTTVVPVFDHEDPADPSAILTTAGATLQMIQWGLKIWVLDAANQVTLLAATLANPRTTVRDDIALVAGVSSTGDLTLVRYRPAQGPEEITIEHGVDPSFVPTVIATVEGDAIVGGASDTFIVPATTNVVAPLHLANVGLAGFSRGDSTVVVAGNALYAYDELGPGPRLTMLVAPLPGLHAVALDPDRGAPTDYFAYGELARVARIVYAGTTPALVEAPCVGDPAQVYMLGRDHDGIPIAACETQLESFVFQLATAGPQLVAHFQSEASFFRDSRLAEHPVVAWGGQSFVTFQDTVCLASHPERCWRINGSTRTMLGIDSFADTFTYLSYDIGTAVNLWIMRPLGLGEEPQPVP